MPLKLEHPPGEQAVNQSGIKWRLPFQVVYIQDEPNAFILEL